MRNVVVAADLSVVPMFASSSSWSAPLAAHREAMPSVSRGFSTTAFRPMIQCNPKLAHFKNLVQKFFWRMRVARVVVGVREDGGQSRHRRIPRRAEASCMSR
jgi:hypothetical protein